MTVARRQQGGRASLRETLPAALPPLGGGGGVEGRAVWGADSLPGSWQTPPTDGQGWLGLLLGRLQS